MTTELQLTEQRTLKPGTVLVVDNDQDRLEIVSLMLRAAGFAVIPCSGPGHPDYRCIGTVTHDCPIVPVADVVVLGGSLPGEVIGEGVALWELATYYASSGLAVIVLPHEGRWLSTYPEAGTVTLPTHWSREMLICAVEAALAGARAESEAG